MVCALRKWRATRVRCNHRYHVQSYYEGKEENKDGYRGASLRDYGIRIMQRYTKCVPFYRINYLALYSILSFIQRGGRANAARFYHTRIYYSHASFSPSFVFTSRMTHRRIIFASRVRLLISSHAFLRVRSLSFFPPPFSIFYFTPLFLFFYFSFSLAPESIHDRKEKDGTAHGTTHGLAFVAR